MAHLDTSLKMYDWYNLHINKGHEPTQAKYIGTASHHEKASHVFVSRDERNPANIFVTRMDISSAVKKLLMLT